MYTRCPGCEAVYELSTEELAEAAGVVRCSNCGKTFNSLAQLFIRPPEEDESPLRGQGMPPLLAHRILLQACLPGLDPAASDSDPRSADTRSQPADDAAQIPSWPDSVPARAPWPALSALLALLAIVQGLWLLDLPAWWDEHFGAATASPAQTGQITLIGRDMHPHPSREDGVVISALLRNDSPHRAEFPLIELRVFDRSNQLLGVRRLQPDEYLPDPARAPRGLGPGNSLPLIIEVAQTGSLPSGFEFRFFQQPGG